MNIAFIIPALANKGPVLVVKDIVKFISPFCKVNVFYFDDIDELKIDAPSERIGIKQKIDFDKFDIFHSHGIRPDYYLWKNKKYITGKIISTMHNYMFDDLKYQYNFLSAFIFSKIWICLLKRFDKVVVLSDHMKEYYMTKINVQKLFIIYNGRSLDKEDMLNKLDKKDETYLSNIKKKYIVLGVIAQLTKRKGIDQIIRTLRDLKNYCIIIVGGGKDLQRLKHLSIKYGVEDRCFFLGHRKSAWKYFPYFDVYLMLSRSEGFPLALIEAASHHLSIVCSDIPVFKELFSKKELVFFELDNLNSLQQGIVLAYNNREKYGQHIYQMYQSRLKAEIMANNYFKLYENLMA